MRLALLSLVICASPILGGGVACCETEGHPDLADAPVHDYELVNVYPHDQDAFTQGLIYIDGFLYEGTGLYGASSLRKVRIETGDILKIHYLAPEYFGEGITYYNDTIFQLTWENHVGFAYVELDTFELIDSFGYPYIGWGLTHDDTSLILSDGSHRLYHLDPQTFEEIGRIEVRAEGSPVSRLNELEYVQGRIYANILGSGYVAVIEPQTGDVSGWIDLRNMHTPRGVHNGIAYDPDHFRLFVTGKRWEDLYEIRVDPIDYPPEIVYSSPHSPIWIGVDSMITLTMQCRDPDTEDTLEYIWSINGVLDVSAHDTSYAYTSSVVTSDAIVARVVDGTYSDSTSWIVNVGATELSHSSPNPFTTETAIRLVLQKEEHVRLRVYDIAGRLVRTLVNRRLPPGPHRVVWDGLDSSARRVAAGLYFAELRVPGFRATRKMVLLR